MGLDELDCGCDVAHLAEEKQQGIFLSAQAGENVDQFGVQGRRVSLSFPESSICVGNKCVVCSD